MCHFAVCLAGADHEVMWKRGNRHARGQEHARAFSLAFMTENNSLDLITIKSLKSFALSSLNSLAYLNREIELKPG